MSTLITPARPAGLLRSQLSPGNWVFCLSNNRQTKKVHIICNYLLHIQKKAFIFVPNKLLNQMNFNLTNILSQPSRNGFSLQATLIINGVSVCRMDDDGDGSQPSFEVYNKPMFQLWEQGVEQMPEMYVEAYGCTLKIDKGMFIDLLHYALESKTDFKLLAA